MRDSSAIHDIDLVIRMIMMMMMMTSTASTTTTMMMMMMIIIELYFHTIMLKVTVYLHGCLASERCSASGLKLKLIELAIKSYQEF